MVSRSFIDRTERCLVSLAGWRRRLAAFGAGALTVLAMAPFHAWPVLWLTLPGLVWLLDGALRTGGTAPERRRLWRAAEVGWWFGFGYFLLGLFWVGEAFLVEAEVFAWLLPFAVTLLPAGLALFYAVAAALAGAVWRRDASRVVALALALSTAEWLRGHVLTGFPWNVLGYAITAPVGLMQSAAVLGIYGLTLVTVLVFGSPLVMAAGVAASDRGARMRRALVVAIGPLAMMWIAGEARLATNLPDTSASNAPDGATAARLRIVQPSIPQRAKWRPENQESIFLDHLRLSETAPDGSIDGAAGITHVVWPEAAMPFLPLQHPAALAAIGRALMPGRFLITGALRAETPDASQATARRRIFNSILVLSDAGRLVAHYDKIHLVPFGEYLPMQTALETIGLEQLTRMRGGFGTGVHPRPLLEVPGLPATAALICYEAIFPGAVIQGAARPRLMVNVTNDGWFGNSSGPRQHLHQARVRAVEEGIPLVRAANNGISAVIDAHGRVFARLDFDIRGTLDSPLPHVAAAPPYARLGDGIFLAIWLATFGCWLWARRMAADGCDAGKGGQ